MAAFENSATKLTARTLCLLTLAILTAISAVSHAAESATTQASKPTTGASSIEATPEAIAAQIKRVQVNSDLKDEDKQKLLKIYAEALSQVQLAAEAKARTEDREKERINGPQLLAELKEKLDTPPVKHALDLPREATLVQLEQRLAKAEADLSAARKRLADIEDNAPTPESRTNFPKQIAELNKQLEEVRRQQNAPLLDEPLELRIAHRTQARAKRKLLQERIDAYEAGLRSLDIRMKLSHEQRRLALRDVAEADKQVKAWQQRVNDRRQAEAAQAAEEAQRKVAGALPAVSKLFEENANLARERNAPDGPAKQIGRVTADLDKAQAQLDALKLKFEGVPGKAGPKGIKAKVQKAGVTNSISMLLRKERANLPDVRTLARDLEDLQPRMATVQSRLIQHEENRDWYADLDTREAEVMGVLRRQIRPEQLPQIEEIVRQQLKQAAEFTDNLIDDYDKYMNKLSDLDITKRELMARSKEYASYIDENVFWFRSTSAIGPSCFTDTVAASKRLFDRSDCRNALGLLKSDVRGNPPLGVLAILAFTGCMYLQRSFRRPLPVTGSAAGRVEVETFSNTLRVFAGTLLVAAIAPAVLAFLAWRLAYGMLATDFTKEIAAGLNAAAAILLTLEILRHLCRPEGVAERHFRWSARTVRTIRRHLYWFMAIAVPAVFIMTALDWENDEPGKASLGRMAFIILLVALAVFMHKVIGPVRLAIQRNLARRWEGWGLWTHYVWYPLLVGTPVVLALVAGLGYHYTAVELSRRLLATLWILFGMLLGRELLLRWMFLANRRLALTKRRHNESGGKETPPAPPAISATIKGAVTEEDQEMNVFTISHQARKLLDSFSILILVVALWQIWADVVPALKRLDQVNVWTYRLVDVGVAVVIFFMTYVAAKNIPGLLEITILPRLPLDHGLRFAITSVTRYLIIILGVVAAFKQLGHKWKDIDTIVAALMVGISFGLQEIVANFVSGLIILFERPMRVGDIVTVGGTSGTVTRIQIRATTITDPDRKELIVPNKEFITGRVVNWTLTDRIVRLAVPVGIAYGSDTDQAQKILLAVAKANPRVAKAPPPTAVFTGFGATTLDFEVGVFTAVENIGTLRHELNTEINKAFHDAGIQGQFQF